jgi:type IV pilus biogenesis protein CpaD/CtpE
MKNTLRTILLALLMAGAAGLLAGCATDDPDNMDAKPWNLPQNWEGPMPSNINQGR